MNLNSDRPIYSDPLISEQLPVVVAIQVSVLAEADRVREVRREVVFEPWVVGRLDVELATVHPHGLAAAAVEHERPGVVDPLDVIVQAGRESRAPW